MKTLKLNYRKITIIKKVKITQFSIFYFINLLYYTNEYLKYN